MNKLGLSSNLVCIKISRPFVLFGFEGQKLGTILENKHSVLRLDATVKNLSSPNYPNFKKLASNKQFLL